MNCGNCKYFADFTDLGMGLRCMNKRNSPKPGDFLNLKDTDYYCSHHIPYSLESMFEWDESKNKSNQNKHGLGFDSAYDLIKDESMLQMVEHTAKWEDLSGLPDHVERNEGNTDPIRGKLVGSIDGKTFTAIYTFRGAIGDMRYRIISLRRADKRECEAYQGFKDFK